MQSRLAAFTCTALLLVPSLARADAPATQYVYNFTYSANQDISARDSGATQGVSQDNVSGGGNGMSHYGGTLNDKGTMTVDVMGKQPDGGLIVNISEQGENTRRAPAATCVTYGNTRVICDPNKTVYTEEYTLLRFLGPNFVDPNQLDAKKHWQTSQPGSGETVTADYTINSNSGGIMQIGETRTSKPTNGAQTTLQIEAKITYDYGRSLPTAIDEYVQQRSENGVTGTSKTTYQTTLALASSTPAKP